MSSLYFIHGPSWNWNLFDTSVIALTILELSLSSTGLNVSFFRLIRVFRTKNKFYRTKNWSKTFLRSQKSIEQNRQTMFDRKTFRSNKKIDLQRLTFLVVDSYDGKHRPKHLFSFFVLIYVEFEFSKSNVLRIILLTCISFNLIMGLFSTSSWAGQELKSFWYSFFNSPLALRLFNSFHDRRTDGRTDGWMDGRTTIGRSRTKTSKKDVIYLEHSSREFAISPLIEQMANSNLGSSEAVYSLSCGL